MKNQPSLDWPVAPNTYYTVVMNDLDVNSRQDPSFRSFIHWLAVNVPGKDLANGELRA